jgi:hypothetical protein
VVSHNSLAHRNLSWASPENSSQPTECHQLVKSAADETAAEVLLPLAEQFLIPIASHLGLHRADEPNALVLVALTRFGAHLVHYQSDSGGRQN